MRKLTFTLCSLLLLTCAPSPSVYNHGVDAAVSQHDALDVYGNICWEDEKAHLDNFAITLQENPE